LKKVVKNPGFSLIEVMVAVAIMAIVSITSIAYFGTMAGKTQDVKHDDYAIKLAADKIEQIRSESYWAASPGAPVEAIPQFGVTFYRGFMASEPSLPQGRFKVIVVTVTWMADGAMHEINLATRISPKGE
jgi:prepilin-type N-terminal cleavage/methylation domain-containing protein